jgi:hypothetical protein
VVVAVFLVSTAGHTPPGPLFSAGAQAPSESVAQAAVPITGTGSPGPGAAHPGAAAPTPTTAAGGSGAEDSGGSPSPTGAEGGQAPVAAAALRPPRITSVLPATGTILGGNTVTIRGRHFTPDAKVFFNSVRVRHVTRLGNRTLRIVVPSAQSVAINAPLSQLHGLRAGVRVVTAGGQSAIGPASLYTYV